MTSNEASRRQIEEEIWAGIRAFVRAHEHHSNLRERLGLGLGSGRVHALLLLKDGPLSLGEIAKAHQVDAPYATIIVNRLEELGYVERHLDPADRRRKLVALTPAGHQAATLAAAALSAPPPPLAHLDMSELHTLDTLLHRLLTPPTAKDPS